MPDVKFVTQISGDTQVIERLDKIDRKIDTMGKTGTKSKTALQRALIDIGNSGKKAADDISQAESAFSRLGMSAGSVTKILGGFGIGFGIAGAIQVIKAGVGTMVSFESAFAGVRKTVNASEAEFMALERGFRDMAKEIPVAADELANIGQAAGQLGIKTENILGFTRTMADLGVATNLSSDQAATALARLANITKMPQDQFDELGSTIVALGNNFATTESEIVEMSMRIAGAGNQIGLSNGQILGFAAALSSLGIEAEAGGSAISKVFIEIASQVETGGKKLGLFSKVAGMTSKEFQAAFEQDAAGAVNRFITGLGKMKEDGGSVLQVLADLGIEEVRMRDALLRASGAGDLLTRTLDLQGKAWKENTALTDEANRRYATTESQWQKFKNTLSEFAISLGDVVLPVLRVLIQVLGGVVDGLTRATTEFINFIASIPDRIKIPSLEDLNAQAEKLKKLKPLDLSFEDIQFFQNKTPAEIDATVQKLEKLETQVKGMGYTFKREGKSFSEYTQELTMLQENAKKFQTNGKINVPFGMEEYLPKDPKKHKETIQLTEEEKKEYERLSDAMKAAATPADELARQMELLRKGGADSKSVMAAYADKLVDAADRQKVLGIYIKDSTGHLVAQAREFKKNSTDVQEKQEKAFADMKSISDEYERDRQKKMDDYVKDFMKKAEEDLRTFKEVKNRIDQETMQYGGRKEELEIEREQLETVQTRGREEAQIIEDKKIFLDFEIKKEEVKLRFAQLRMALEEKIATMDANSPLKKPAEDKLKELSEAERQAIEALARLEGIEIAKSHKNNYLDMIKTIRDGAGQVFDALLSGGKNAFGSLLDWMKSFFFTQLRTLFQNTIEFFAKKGQGQGGSWTQIFSGVFGQSGNKFNFGDLFGQKDFSFKDFLGGGGGGFFGTKGEGGFLGSGTGGINGKGVGGAAGAMMLAGGAQLGIGGVMDVGNNSVGSWAKSVGGGAMAGFALAGPLGAAIGAAVGALAKGIGSLVDWAQGKSNAQAGREEISRDYGGVKMSEDVYNQMVESFGFGKDSGSLWRARGSVAASPQMLAKMFELAQGQGKTDEFMGRMNNWLTYTGPHGDASRALQIGELTGDWSKLNDLWKQSQYYQDLVNRGLKEQADNMVMGGDAAFEAAKTFESYFQEAKKTGEVTKELTDFIKENRDKLEEAGETYSIVAEDLAQMDKVLANLSKNAVALGRIAAAKDALSQMKTSLEQFNPDANPTLAKMLDEGLITVDEQKAITAADNIYKLSQYFNELTKSALETGDVMNDLTGIMKEFGGSADIVRQGKELKGLLTSISGIDDFRKGLDELSKTTTGLEDVLSGLWNSQVVKKLMIEGFDPGEFEGLAQIIRGMKDWDEAVKEFNQTGMLTSAGISADARKILDAAGLTATQLLNVQNAIGGTQIKMTESGQLIADMLKKYGGQEGQIAAENLLNGVNSVSDQLLEKTKANMDAALEQEKEGILGYLDEAESGLKEKADAIKAAMQAEFDAVSSKIEEAFYKARETAVSVIDEILERLKTLNDSLTFGMASASAALNSAAPATEPTDFYSGIVQGALANGGQVTGTAVPRGESTSTASSGSAQVAGSNIQVVNQFYGNQYGLPDLEEFITQVTLRNFASGVYQGVN